MRGGAFTGTGAVKPGGRIGEYRVKEQIAVGGFGTVWRAEHLHSGQVAAIKILHAHLITAESLVKRFEREARAIALMSHPNIVRLYQHGRLPDGRPYLTMEYLEGVDLGARIAMRGTIAPREILDILTQLGDALAAAHALGIVHRDLKASNVFLSERHGRPHVVLFDFGIAKLLDRNDGSLTASSSLIGSPACMSPEQILGRPVDARTDVYALGSLTYQMLVGHPPFSGANSTAVLTMHLDDDPPYPSLHGDVSPVFDGVVMKAMSKEPGQRFQRVADFVAAFGEALASSESGRARTAPAALPEPAPAVGLYVDVGADPAALEEPEDALLDDLESVVPAAARILAARGYLTAHDRGTSALFVRPLDARDVDHAAARRRELEAAMALFAAIDNRAGRDERARVRLYVHCGDAILAGAEVEGGSLLDARDWIPPAELCGVYASRDMLAGLDAQLEALPWSSRVVRLIELAPPVSQGRGARP